MRFIVTIFVLFIEACGQDSWVDCKNNKSYIHQKCVEQTPDEKAVLALNDGDFAGAIKILEELIRTEPFEYYRYPRLASAYAGLSGFDILNIASIQSSGDSNGVDGVGKFITPPTRSTLSTYGSKLDNMMQARDVLALLPENIRSSDSGYFYSVSAQFQYMLYLTSYSIMCLNLYQLLLDPEDPDFATLATFTQCPADGIVESLLLASLVANSGNPSLAGKILELKQKIDDSEGVSNQEKLASYIMSK